MFTGLILQISKCYFLLLNDTVFDLHIVLCNLYLVGSWEFVNLQQHNNWNPVNTWQYIAGGGCVHVLLYLISFLRSIPGICVSLSVSFRYPILLRHNVQVNIVVVHNKIKTYSQGLRNTRINIFGGKQNVDNLVPTLTLKFILRFFENTVPSWRAPVTQHGKLNTWIDVMVVIENISLKSNVPGCVNSILTGTVGVAILANISHMWPSTKNNRTGADHSNAI